MIRYEKLPEALRDGMRRYIEDGIRPGRFLSAVLENDLFAALNRADDNNRAELHSIVGFMYNELPAGAWGSKRAVKNWLKRSERERG